MNRCVAIAVLSAAFSAAMFWFVSQDAGAQIGNDLLVFGDSDSGCVVLSVEYGTFDDALDEWSDADAETVTIDVQCARERWPNAEIEVIPEVTTILEVVDIPTNILDLISVDSQSQDIEP